MLQMAYEQEYNLKKTITGTKEGSVDGKKNSLGYVRNVFWWFQNNINYYNNNSTGSNHRPERRVISNNFVNIFSKNVCQNSTNVRR